MHPYLNHLLEDIKNAHRPGYREEHPFLSNYDPKEMGDDDSNNRYADWDEPQDEPTPFKTSAENNPKDIIGDIEKESGNFFDDDEDMDDLDNPYDDDLAAHFAEIERFISEDPPHSFGYYCGLNVADFPPAEQLTDDDMIIIIKAFEKMSKTWNIDFSFPETLPTHLYYKILTNTLDEKTMIVNDGFITFDYCSGSPDECIFGEYCNCWKYWLEDDAEKS